MDLTKRNISTRVRPIMTVVIKRLRKPLSETKGK
jgi:ketosteroid isomerase-like protein